MKARKFSVRELFRIRRPLRLQGIYKVFLGRRQGQDIWIVDGARVAAEIYPAFIMGGNDQRYRFNPPGEVWIDNRIGIEELGYTLEHELIERKLMRERGFTYNRAHSEGGLAREQDLRQRQQRRIANQQRKHPSLRGVYRCYFGKRRGLSIWIVDGNRVRRDFEADFCFGSHDKEFPFIPEGEIWLDAAMSVEEAIFTLAHEQCLRSLMASGTSYDEAYVSALETQYRHRDRQSMLAREHEARLPAVTYGVRERGLKAPRN